MAGRNSSLPEKLAAIVCVPTLMDAVVKLSIGLLTEPRIATVLPLSVNVTNPPPPKPPGKAGEDKLAEIVTGMPKLALVAEVDSTIESGAGVTLSIMGVAVLGSCVASPL